MKNCSFRCGHHRLPQAVGKLLVDGGQHREGAWQDGRQEEAPEGRGRRAHACESRGGDSERIQLHIFTKLVQSRRDFSVFLIDTFMTGKFKFSKKN